MTEGENMVERCARAWFISETGQTRDGAMEWLLFDDEVKDEYRKHARAVIEALIDMPAGGETLARVEEVARALNRHRTEDHIKSVALDSLSIHREILRSYLRTALSKPNEEGEGK